MANFLCELQCSESMILYFFYKQQYISERKAVMTFGRPSAWPTLHVGYTIITAYLLTKKAYVSILGHRAFLTIRRFWPFNLSIQAQMFINLILCKQVCQSMVNHVSIMCQSCVNHACQVSLIVYERLKRILSINSCLH